MRGGWKIVAGVAIVATAAFFGLPREKEPTYHEVKLSEWLFRFANHDRESVKALQAIGTNALPFLLDWTSYRTPRWRKKLAPLADRLPARWKRSAMATWLRRDTKEFRADAAVIGFVALGREAIPAIPDLCRLHASGRDAGNFEGLLMLDQFGLVDQFKNPEPIDWDSMMSRAPSMMYSFKSPESAASILIELLQDADKRVAESAAWILGELDFAADFRGMPHNSGSREENARQIGDIAVALLQACTDSDPRVRMAATHALQRLGDRDLMAHK